MKISKINIQINHHNWLHNKKKHVMVKKKVDIQFRAAVCRKIVTNIPTLSLKKNYLSDLCVVSDLRCCRFELNICLFLCVNCVFCFLCYYFFVFVLFLFFCFFCVCFCVFLCFCVSLLNWFTKYYKAK